jgi:hypothetical protein
VNIDAHWFRRRPEKGGTWAVRLRWSNWEDGRPIQRQEVVETPHTELSKAVTHPMVIFCMSALTDHPVPFPNVSTRVDNLKMD